MLPQRQPNTARQIQKRPQPDWVHDARLESVLELISEDFHVPREKILAATRSKAWIALARQVAMYLANVEAGVPMTHIAQFFHRDRSTVSWACARMEDLRDDPYYEDKFGALAEKLHIAIRQTNTTCVPDQPAASVARD